MSGWKPLVRNLIMCCKTPMVEMEGPTLTSQDSLAGAPSYDELLAIWDTGCALNYLFHWRDDGSGLLIAQNKMSHSFSGPVGDASCESVLRSILTCDAMYDRAMSTLCTSLDSHFVCRVHLPQTDTSICTRHQTMTGLIYTTPSMDALSRATKIASLSTTPVTSWVVITRSSSVLSIQEIPANLSLPRSEPLPHQSLLAREQTLLEDMFPRHVIEHLVAPQTSLSMQPMSTTPPTAKRHACVTVLFADIVGFTAACSQASPREVMTFLNDYFSVIDELADIHGVYKVETIGDCYMVAAGITETDADGFNAVLTEGRVDPFHAARVFAFARDLLSVVRRMRISIMPHGGAPQIRVGLHSGPVMSGLVGKKMPRFCLFGDTVNTASRMESTGIAGSIHASAETVDLIGGGAGWVPTGGVHCKGKGMVQTFLWKNPNSIDQGSQQKPHVRWQPH